MNASPHCQRILTAIVAVGLVGLALWLGGILITLAVLGLTALGTWEFTAMFRPGPEHKSLRLTGVVLSAGIILAARLGGLDASLWAFVACFWVLALRFLFRFSRQQEHTDAAEEMILLAGLAYLPLMIQLLFLMSTPEILLVLASTVASDTAAYYAGTFLGKKKIWPQISPKKSWAGSIGGMTGCVAAVSAYGLLLGNAPVYAWVLLGILLNVAAQMGDFFESALKRKLAVKDSGTLLPGHGGLLDRIDSLLLALPCYVLYRMLIPLFP